MNNNKLCVNLVHCGNRSLINSNDQDQKNIFFMPMGLFPLASVLKDNGVEVEIIHTDLEFSKNIEEIFNFESLDAVGFDCHWINESLVVIETIEYLKSIKPDLFCFLGGFSASLFAEEIVDEFNFIDAVIKGDGEIPIKELIHAITEVKLKSNFDKILLDKKLKKVQNITWKNNEGRIIHREITYVGKEENLNCLNFTEVELLRNWEYYRSASTFYSHFQPISQEPMFLLEVGRGCQYACKFCGGNSVAQKKMNNRTTTVFRSQDSVIKTIKEACNLGFNTFYTCMEREGSDRWYIELLKKIKLEKLEFNYGYGCWRLPSKELIDALSDSCNQVVIEVSPESGVESVRYLNKDKRISYSNDQIIDFLDYIKTKENVKAQLFFGYYCVGDKKSTIYDTLKFIVHLLINYKGLVEIEYANFSTDPGSLIFFNPKKHNMDMKVSSFNDYLQNLKNNYVDKNDQPADMTLFKPKDISEKDDLIISKIVTLFNSIFSIYRNSMYCYFFELEYSFDTILSIIEEYATFNEKEISFSNETIKLCLENGFKKHNFSEERLFQVLQKEYENINRVDVISKPTTQLYFDNEIESTYLDLVEEDWNSNMDFTLDNEFELF